MGLSAASALSLLLNCDIVDAAAATDAFIMLCDAAAGVKSSRCQIAAKRSDDEAVPLYLHACRLIASCISSSSSSSRREQFESLCKVRVIPLIAAELSTALDAPPALSSDPNSEAPEGTQLQLSPVVACATALCRCRSLVSPVVASFVGHLIQHLEVVIVFLAAEMAVTHRNAPFSGCCCDAVAGWNAVRIR